jgi:hypothetical protein
MFAIKVNGVEIQTAVMPGAITLHSGDTL